MLNFLRKFKNRFRHLFFNEGENEEGGIPIAILLISGIGIGASGLLFGWEKLSQVAIDLVAAISGLLSTFGEFFGRFSVKIADQMISWATETSITRHPGSLKMWALTKSWANMLIVIGLLGIAIATILRFRDYEAKKLLAPFLIVALMINFSNVLVGSMIDLSNITMRSLAGTSSSMGNDLIDGISDQINALVAKSQKPPSTFVKVTCLIGASGLNFIIPSLLERCVSGVQTLTQPKDLPSALKEAGAKISYMIMFYAIGLAFAYFALILLQRYVILTFLFVVAPLAFVFRVFPIDQAKKLWSDWWHNLIKWSFMGIGGLFALRIAYEYVSIFKIPGVPMEIGEIMITLGFIIIGLRITKKSAGPVADFVTKGATALGAIALTGGVATLAGAAGGVARATGLSGLAQRAKNKITDKWEQVREKLPGGITGTAAMKTAKRAEERAKPYKEAAAHVYDINVLNRESRTGPTEKRAAYAHASLEKGGFFKEYKTEAEQKDALYNMQAHGFSIKEAIEKNPELSKYKIDDFQKLKSLKPELSDAQIEQELVEKARRKADLAKLVPEAINLHTIEESSDRKLSRAIPKFDVDQLRRLASLRIEARENSARAHRIGDIAERDRMRKLAERIDVVVGKEKIKSATREEGIKSEKSVFRPGEVEGTELKPTDEEMKKRGAGAYSPGVDKSI